MTEGLPQGPEAVDTMIISWLFRRDPKIQPYERYLTGRQFIVSFVTVAELRYGAANANWGERRKEQLDERLAAMRVVLPDDDLVNAYVVMRDQCERIGDGLHAKDHEADRWIAATAIRYRLQLVSHDKIFDKAPGLVNIRL